MGNGGIEKLRDLPKDIFGKKKKLKITLASGVPNSLLCCLPEFVLLLLRKCL